MVLQIGVNLAGRYRLEAPLGRGGFGEVWRGVDTELARPVAIKVMLATDLEVSVQQEARAAAALQHPGITVVHDLGRHEGQLFMVMELLDGRDLGRVLAQTPSGLPAGQVRSIGTQVADALAAAHARQVVHRDLKPANLMLLAGGRVKICDFGMARIIQATAYQTATLAGTPAFMAPEQFAGQIDHRVDLYALGCVLYALGTGQAPFRADQDWPALMYQHLNAEPADPRSIRPQLPADLAELVLELLRKDPGQRPASSAVVERLSAGERAPAGHPPTELAFGGGARRTLMDPERAVELLVRAAWTAHEIDDDQRRNRALIVVAGYLSRIDPVRAESVAREAPLKNEPPRTLAHINRAILLASAVHGLAAVDPGRARGILTEAERLARRTATKASLAAIAVALTHVAGQAVKFDAAWARALLSSAEGIVRSIRPRASRTPALYSIAVMYSALDPARAEQLARDISDPERGVTIMTSIAGRLSRSDPGRAHALLLAAQQRIPEIASAGTRESRLADIVGRLAVIDLARAEYTVGGVTHPFHRARALATLGWALAAHDPARARAYLDEAEQGARRLTSAADRSRALADVARGWEVLEPPRARALVAEAEALLPSIAEPYMRAVSLARLGGVGAGIILDDL